MQNEKTFRNNAPQPMQVPLVAFYGESGTVTAVRRRRGYASGLDHAERVEAQRIFLWARDTFVGQHELLFRMHSGVLPVMMMPEYAPLAFDFETYVRPHNQPGKSEAQFHLTSGSADFLHDNDRRYVVLDGIDVHRIAEAMLTTPGILDLLRPKQKEVNVDFTFNGNDVIGDLEKWAATLAQDELRRGRKVDPSIYTKAYGAQREGPIPGTYWQSRTEPTRFFKMTNATSCIGHWHVEMHCLQDGEPEDRLWVSDKQWGDLFAKVDRVTAHAPLSPQSSVGSHASRVPAASLKPMFHSGGYVGKMPVASLAFPNLRDAVHEREQKEVEQFVAEVEAQQETTANPVVEATQQVLDAVPFTGTEKPPAVGEKYQRVGSEEVFTVIDVARKLYHWSDSTVTLETGTGTTRVKRHKHVFRNHAQWLSKWRPVDSEGNVKPVEFVDLEEFIDGALGAEDDKAEPALSTRNEDENAVRWIRVIGRELDRRVPGWREHDEPGVLYDDCALIIRAIRYLNRQGVDFGNLAVELREQNKAQLQMAEAHNKRMTKVETWLREIAREASVSFKNTYGIEKTKGLLKEFGYDSLVQVPEADLVSWVRKLREYAAGARFL